jgi:hypothetical protein
VRTNLCDRTAAVTSLINDELLAKKRKKERKKEREREQERESMLTAA